jgi:catalase (peroxidase I)
MTENIVAGCVAVALIVLALIGFAQARHECWNGHVVKNWRHEHVLITREHCGSVSPKI